MKQKINQEQKRELQQARLNARYDVLVEVQDAIRERIEQRSTVMYSETGVDIRANMMPTKRAQAERLRKTLFHQNNEAFDIFHIISKMRNETVEEMKTNYQY